MRGTRISVQSRISVESRISVGSCILSVRAVTLGQNGETTEQRGHADVDQDVAIDSRPDGRDDLLGDAIAGSAMPRAIAAPTNVESVGEVEVADRHSYGA